MLTFLYELLIALLLSYFFYIKEKPAIRYLLYGYLMFFISLTIQFPFYYFAGRFDPLQFNLLPIVLLLLAIIISELTKYFSLKRFLKTKSIKNGIFFGIGWVTIESISFFSIMYYTYLSSLFSQAGTVVFLGSNLQFFFSNFIIFFIINLAITILVIFSVVKKKLIYLILAILFSVTILLGFNSFFNIDELLFTILLLIISGLIIFKYKFLQVK